MKTHKTYTIQPTLASWTEVGEHRAERPGGTSIEALIIAVILGVACFYFISSSGK